jgi:dihydrofolate synthase/folylpolyglutamate synthase
MARATLDELTPWLFSRVTGGIRWGLERTEELLAGVDDPHRRFNSIHIAGTNGKGSVAAFCDAILRADGQSRIGLYTSPHLVSFTERIRIDGKPVDEGVLLDAATRLRPAIEQTGASFFEATTALAFLIFAELRVDLAVIEVGLGGRLDATNVITPLATAVTNVARDHEEYLGTSLTDIAREKAGIFKLGVPALSGSLDDGVRAVLREVAREKGAPFHELHVLAAIEDLETDLDGTRFRLLSHQWGEMDLTTTLPGEHQARNAALAIELLGLLPDSLRPSIEAVEDGVRGTRWSGRLQLEKIRGTTWLFDVAHNPAGAQVLAEWIRAARLTEPVVLVAGILSDKDWKGMLTGLGMVADALVLTVASSAPESRRWNPDEVGAWAREQGLPPTRVIPDLQSALGRASTMAPHGTVVVTGSVHTVGDAMKLLDLSV